MHASDLIRKYFSAYENKDREAIEFLLTHDFVFTSHCDHRIVRQTYFKRCWPYSEKSPTYVIEKLFEEGNEAFILYDCKTTNGSSSRNTDSSPLKELDKRGRGPLLVLPQRHHRKQRLQKSLLTQRNVIECKPTPTSALEM